MSTPSLGRRFKSCRPDHVYQVRGLVLSVRTEPFDRFDRGTRRHMTVVTVAGRQRAADYSLARSFQSIFAVLNRHGQLPSVPLGSRQVQDHHFDDLVPLSDVCHG